MALTPTQLESVSAGQLRWINRIAWLNGIYTRAALTEVFSAVTGGKGSSRFNYPAQPYEQLQAVTEQDKAKQEENELLIAKLYMNNMMRAGKNWGEPQRI